MKRQKRKMLRIVYDCTQIRTNANMDNMMMDYEQLTDFMKYLYPKINNVYQFANNGIIDQCVDNVYDAKIDSNEIYISDDSEIYQSDEDIEYCEKEFWLSDETVGSANQLLGTVVNVETNELETPHIKYPHISKINTCESCKDVTKTLVLHMYNNHSDGIYRCETCDYKCSQCDNKDKSLVSKEPALFSYVRRKKGFDGIISELKKMGDTFKLVEFKKINFF